MADDAGSSPPPVTDPSRAVRAESYLRRLAERELRWFAEQPDPSSSPADGPPPPGAVGRFAPVRR
jgi:hypothetical protein